MRIIFGLFFASFVAFGADFNEKIGQLKFGSEFTFTNDSIIKAGLEIGDGGHSTNESRAAIKKWVSAIEKHGGYETLSSSKDVADFADSDDVVILVKVDEFFWFKISSDGWVLETQMTPMTIPQMNQYVDQVQEMIFNTAASANLTPHHRIGGGHVHIDLAGAFFDLVEQGHTITQKSRDEYHFDLEASFGDSGDENYENFHQDDSESNEQIVEVDQKYCAVKHPNINRFIRFFIDF